MKIKPLLCAAMVAATCLVAPSTVYAAGYASAGSLTQALFNDAVKSLTGKSGYVYNVGSRITSDTTNNAVMHGGLGTEMKVILQETNKAAIGNSYSNRTIVYDPTTDEWKTDPHAVAYMLNSVDKDLLITEAPLDRNWQDISSISMLELGDVELWQGNTTNTGNNITTTIDNLLAGQDMYNYQGKRLYDYTVDSPLTFIPSVVEIATGHMYVGDTIMSIWADAEAGTLQGKIYKKDGSVADISWLSSDGTDVGTTATYGEFVRIGVGMLDNSDGTVSCMPFVRKNAYVTNGYIIGNSTGSVTTSFTKVGTADEVYTGPLDYKTICLAPIYTLGDLNPTSIIGLNTANPRMASIECNPLATSITINDEGWTIYERNESDEESSLTDPNTTADVPAIVNIEGMAFKVIVPTSLPIEVDSSGIVHVASNATVENESNAAIEITDITVTGKANSGWTLVSGTPSSIRDAKEFRLDAPIPDDPRVERAAAATINYSAVLSPTTDDVVDLEIASVLITVGWAD